MLTDIIKQTEPSLTFNMLNIGAVPLNGETEPSYRLLEAFPGSQVIAFEVSEEVCAELNQHSQNGLKYYAAFLGRAEEERRFYETHHPMCASLYKPNEALLTQFQGLEVALLKSSSIVQTIGLDQFIRDHQIDEIDFIKIDIQGAELDVFQGGIRTLKDTLMIVTEVEFIPLYENQPLFGDVYNFLHKEHFEFHKFLGLAGRTMKPTIIQNNINFPVQHMWSDAVFIKHLMSLSNLNPTQLLKLSILADIYGSPDIAFACLSLYDKTHHSNLSQAYIKSFAQTSS